jgi:hypothetical protein
MSKPVQIAITHQRGQNEQWGSEITLVLCEDGKIYRRYVAVGVDTWEEVKGLWENVEGKIDQAIAKAEGR